MINEPSLRYTQIKSSNAPECFSRTGNAISYTMKKTAALLFFLILISFLNAYSAHAASLNKTKVYLPIGETVRLKVKNAGGAKIVWSSSRPDIVKVSQNGKLRALKAGKAKITAKIGSLTLRCKVYVQELSFDARKTTMVRKSKTALAIHSKYLTQPIIYTSSNPKIASVNSEGIVTAKKKGTVTITAVSGKLETTMIVKVRKLYLDQTILNLQQGDSSQLRLSGSYRTPAFSTSDQAVASVSENGTVTALAAGEATITAVLDEITYTCKVYVSDNIWSRLLNQYRNDSDVRQLLFVKYLSGSNAIVELYTKNNTEWTQVLSCSSYVGRNGIDKQMEGDKKTPTGVFTLTSGFGIAADPGSLQPYVQVNPYLYWCGDSMYYNQLIDIREKPHNCQGEHLIDYTTAYRYGMFLDYNSSLIYQKGSAIFLHCFSSNPYTGGCIAVSETNMIRILQTVEPNAKICIYPA